MVRVVAQVKVVSISLTPVVLHRGQITLRLTRSQSVSLRVQPSGTTLPLSVRKLPFVVRGLLPDGKTRRPRVLPPVIRRVVLSPICFRLCCPSRFCRR